MTTQGMDHLDAAYQGRFCQGAGSRREGKSDRRHVGTEFSIRGRVQPELSRQLLRRAPRAWRDSSPSSSLLLRQPAHCCLGGRVPELSWLGRLANNCEVCGAPDPSAHVFGGTLSFIVHK